MTVSVKAPTSTTGSIQLNGSDVLTIDSSGNLTAPNNLTVTDDATINGLTVGKGSGNVATNTALGSDALYSNTTGSNSTAVGYQALYDNTTGDNNTAIGTFALSNNTVGDRNVAVGYNSLFNCNPLSNTDMYNTAVGYATMYSNTTGIENTALGNSALYFNTTGANNTAIGNRALQNNTTPSNLTAVGYQALYANTTGLRNEAYGYSALRSNTTGSDNFAAGYEALYDNTTGMANVAIGRNTLANSNSDYNTAVGFNCMLNLTSGSNNVALGINAGNLLTTGSQNITLGTNSNPSGATVTGQCTLGSTSITNLRCNDTSISSLSDARDKTNVVDIPLGLDFINKMRPVAFDWDRRDGSMQGAKDFGFIAQELKTIQDETAYAEHLRLVHDDNPEKLEADPMKTYPVLIKAIQELSAKVDALQTEINVLKGE